jgi:hypothetical protein
MSFFNIVLMWSATFAASMSAFAASTSYLPFPRRDRPEVEVLLTEATKVAQDIRTRIGSSPMSSWITKEGNALSSGLPQASWPVTTVSGSMPLPSVLINGRRMALVSGYDSNFDAELLGESLLDQKRVYAAGFVLTEWLGTDPASFFSWVAQTIEPEAVPTEAKTIDVLLVHVALGGVPGERLIASPVKSDWDKLHQSSNPCYRFIALEKFGSVEQSPEALLELYRECLFETCSYLEAVALTEILRRKDFRPEVLALLAEYSATNPLESDGTFVAMRTEFTSLLHGVELVGQRAAGTAKSTVNPTLPVAAPVARGEKQAAPTTPPRSANPNPPEMAMQVPQIEHGSSSRKWWLLLSLIIGGAAYRLLWKRN